jgi:tRNA pseudouridine38-40 synthase
VSPHASLVRGASRTDAGVHARAQRVAFDSDLAIPARGWVMALNAHLPNEIAVVRAAAVDPGFEPRFRAARKTYRYAILESEVGDPFHAGRSWRVGERLNHEAMREASAALVGEHDFRAFRAAGDDRTDTVRHVFRIEVRSPGSIARTTEIIVEGNRFMYRMVRIIVGSLVDVGTQRLDRSRLVLALAEGNRALLGRTAPPDGLCLDSVALDDEGREPWPIDEHPSVA